jgi:hypothetical protein
VRLASTIPPERLPESSSIGWHPGRLVLGDLLLEMERQLRIELALDPTAAEESAHPGSGGIEETHVFRPSE